MIKLNGCSSVYELLSLLSQIHRYEDPCKAFKKYQIKIAQFELDLLCNSELLDSNRLPFGIVSLIYFTIVFYFESIFVKVPNFVMHHIKYNIRLKFHFSKFALYCFIVFSSLKLILTKFLLSNFARSKFEILSKHTVDLITELYIRQNGGFWMFLLETSSWPRLNYKLFHNAICHLSFQKTFCFKFKGYFIKRHYFWYGYNHDLVRHNGQFPPDSFLVLT